jgi:hypothetical protein
MIGRRFILAAALLLGIAALYFQGVRRGAPGVKPPATAVGSITGKEKLPGEKLPAAADATTEANPLAAELNAPNSSIRHDLEVVNNLFVNFQTNFHAGNPVGENAEITAALTGANPLHFAFIPKAHPAINAAGELCDRWGTPFRFHQLSGTQMEIRSAGPDRKFGTADDVEFAPWSKPPGSL